ncbi:DUF4241 domain-containing protein [Halomonas dongshanensis]|uniref:DUF4241 domain-containing protein n=1 Tax=Halomonas dongshanensis TaxID=2890835 RepID=A0ABT2EDB9_9GAMM|nr:DUF4241 domain-containing protein [Halomonas dongshanensis]MCS2609550.1 DUF4241 domain-containing protein [Halomonas dongshanensis]
MKKIIDFFLKKSKYGNVIDSPEDRVNAFISHWYKQWSKAQRKMGDEVNFDYWGDLISDVDGTHFVAGSSSGSRNSFGSKANYDPGIEKITECNIQGNTASVFTEIYDEAFNSSKYHVYDLEFEEEKGWKITKIFTLFHSPKSPVVDHDKHAEIFSMSIFDAPFLEREDHIDLNENKLFQAERSISIPDLEEGVVKLESIGKLRVSSGVLGILDFGYNLYDLEPLQRRVSPGGYPVEYVTINGYVAGIRVKFKDSEESVKWYAANTPSGNGVYSVDSGNLAIFDVGKLMSLSRIKKERILSVWSLGGKPGLVSMVDEDDCVISTSGFGDGYYPAFWGVNAQGEVSSLYIDFMILVRETENGLYESV